jgi:hypothetical protein
MSLKIYTELAPREKARNAGRAFVMRDSSKITPPKKGLQRGRDSLTSDESSGAL